MITCHQILPVPLISPRWANGYLGSVLGAFSIEIFSLLYADAWISRLGAPWMKHDDSWPLCIYWVSLASACNL